MTEHNIPTTAGLLVHYPNANEDDDLCNAPAHSVGYKCSRAAHADGPHVARITTFGCNTETVAAWYNSPQTVCAEIEYKEIHSDICPPGCRLDPTEIDLPMDVDGDDPKTYRQFLHDCLDEWLDNSGGTGIFYIKESGTGRPTR